MATKSEQQQQDQTAQQAPTQVPEGAPPGRFRQLTEHRVDDAERVRVDARTHEPGRYRLSGFDSGPTIDIQFQQGDPAEVGVNGASPAQLLAAVGDQLAQSNDTAAAKHVQQAIDLLVKPAREASAKRRQDADAAAAAPAPAAPAAAGGDADAAARKDAAAPDAGAARAARAAAGR